MTANSRIGFHAVYNGSTRQTSGDGNVELGVYLNELGLPQRARRWVSEKGPDDINLLTKQVADAIGIDVEIYHETTSTAINTPPAQQPPAAPYQRPAYVPPPAPEPQYGADAGGPPGRFLYHGRPFNRVHLAAFVYPPGWAYRRWAIGAALPALFLTPAYYYGGFAAQGLSPPQPGFQWVRYGPDLLLVNVTTGQVVDAVYGAFY
jgi:hypothetical protein